MKKCKAFAGFFSLVCHRSVFLLHHNLYHGKHQFIICEYLTSIVLVCRFWGLFQVNVYVFGFILLKICVFLTLWLSAFFGHDSSRNHPEKSTFDSQRVNQPLGCRSCRKQCDKNSYRHPKG